MQARLDDPAGQLPVLGGKPHQVGPALAGWRMFFNHVQTDIDISSLGTTCLRQIAHPTKDLKYIELLSEAGFKHVLQIKSLNTG